MTNRDRAQTTSIGYLAVFGICVALIIFSRLTNTSADPDLWGYLSFGREFWQFGFPCKDSSSYLPTNDLWIYHEWLTGVSFFKILEKWGFSALQLLKYAVGFLTAGFVFCISRSRGVSTSGALLGLLIITPLFSLSYSPVRAQIFTQLFLVTIWFILVLENNLQFALRVTLAGVIGIFWVNLHGGYIAGVLLLATWIGVGIFTGKNSKKELLIFAAFFAASFINPYGFKYWSGIFTELGAARPDIPEWWSLVRSFQNPEYQAGAIHLGVLLCVACVGIILAFRSYPRESAILLVTGFMSVLHIRHESLFLLAFGSFMPGLIWERIQPWRNFISNSSVIRVSFLIGIIFVALQAAFVTFNKSPLGISLEEYPTQAVQFINNQKLTGNILTELDWGSYLVWQLGESSKVGIDGRYTTVFDPGLIQRYLDFLYGREDSKKFWNKFDHSIVVIRPMSDAIKFIEVDPNWRRVFANEVSEVFIRSDIRSDIVR